MSLDDFPIRDENSKLAAIAESKFEAAIARANCFIIQRADRKDFGTDFQLEALLKGAPSNFRLHVQLKGTAKTPNRDGSLSISVDRTNLNYLLSQSNSLYVCYHATSNRLLFQFAHDVFRDAEHSGVNWRSQSTVTIKLREDFSDNFQSQLAELAIASGKSGRSDRLSWLATPPEEFPSLVQKHVPTITVPANADAAFLVLIKLYESKQYAVISKAFDQFLASIGQGDDRVAYAFLAEINLAMLKEHFDESRIKLGIQKLELLLNNGEPVNAYALANAYLAIKEFNRARSLFRKLLSRSDLSDDLRAMILTNLGAIFTSEENHLEARNCYQMALSHAPNLSEAHFSLATAYELDGDLEKALSHYEQVVWCSDDSKQSIHARARRLKAYFELGWTEKVFQEIGSLLEHAEKHEWILDWCRRFVFDSERQSYDSLAEAHRFWDTYIRKRPNDCSAKEERLKLLAFAKMHSKPVKLNFNEYLAQVKSLIDKAGSDVDAAHLWDRVGHWAQEDGAWENAAVYYRKAFELQPGRYGYCLGVALHYLNRFEEAFPILMEQAEIHKPEGITWAHLAHVQVKMGRREACVESLRKAIEVDPSYTWAYINLGEILWNMGDELEAIKVWRDAFARFPEDEAMLEWRENFPFIL